MAKWHRLLAFGAAGLALAGAASGEAPVWGLAIVAIQHGGRAPGIRTQAFRQENGHWKAMERGSVGPGVILMTARILVGQHRDSTRRPQPR